VPGGTTPAQVAERFKADEQIFADAVKGHGDQTGITIAGGPNVSPWPGAYGFFASAALSPSDIVMSSWVVDQPTDENWVEVFLRPITIQ